MSDGYLLGGFILEEVFFYQSPFSIFVKSPKITILKQTVIF
jgi:hypothetical protein